MKCLLKKVGVILCMAAAFATPDACEDVAVLFHGPDPGRVDNPDDPGSEPAPDDGRTYIRFKNLDLYPVEVFADSLCTSLVAEVPAPGNSQAIQWKVPGETWFYIRYTLSISGLSFTYESSRAYTPVMVDENKTTTIRIPALTEQVPSAEQNEPLTSDVYVKIKNESNFSIKFIKGVTTLTPFESASLLMHGESAVYKTVAGSTSLYKFHLKADGPNKVTGYDMKHVCLLGNKLYTYCAIDPCTKQAAVLRIGTTVPGLNSKAALEEVVRRCGPDIVIAGDSGSENKGKAGAF